MERLTYRGTEQMTEGGMITPSYSDYSTRRIIEKLAEYEDAEEHGLLKRFPCKAGDTVWCIASDNTKIIGHKVLWIEIAYNGSLTFALDGDLDCVVLDNLGKTWFLTKEEAERAKMTCNAKKLF